MPFLPVSPEFVPLVICCSVSVAFVTCVLVLRLAAVEGNVPRWAMPLPLSYAASAGLARSCFRVGLACAALGLTFVAPSTIGAYRFLITSFLLENKQDDIWFYGLMEFVVGSCAALDRFIWLAVGGFFFQAAVPFDDRVLVPLREGVLSCPGGKNRFHSCAACVLFSCSAMTMGILLAISMLSAHTEATYLRLRFWSKLIMLECALFAGRYLSTNCFGACRMGSSQHELTNLEDTHGANLVEDGVIQSVRRGGSAQFGIVCALLTFWLTMASDVEQICAPDSSACESSAWDTLVMYRMLTVFALTASLIGTLNIYYWIGARMSSIDSDEQEFVALQG